jgi:predicted TIM-barrel enzyme
MAFNTKLDLVAKKIAIHAHSYQYFVGVSYLDGQMRGKAEIGMSYGRHIALILKESKHCVRWNGYVLVLEYSREMENK